MADLDAIVIGAGHNGLTCAAYLAMAGLAVHVQERRPLLGGACITEEFYPGFRNSTAAYAVSLLQPKIIRDLRLHDHGLQVIERRAQNFLPLLDGRYLLMGEGRSEREIAKFSVKDAQHYSAYRDEIGRVAGAIRSMMLNAPPNVRLDSIERAWCEIRSFFGIGKDLWKAGAL
jgi:phytoene dehydrogenase-like protein